VRFEHPVRLPLQVGTTALVALARGAYTLLPAVALMLVTVVALGVATLLSVVLPGIGWLVLGVLLAEGALVSWGYRSLKLALRARPSDVVLDREGLRVEGGRHDGVRLTWAELDAKKTRIEKRKDARVLVVGTIEIAEVELADELASLRALEQTLRSFDAFDAGPRAEPVRGAPMLLECTSCGATVAPDDAEKVPCGHCDAHVTVPGPLRERIGAHRSVVKDRARSVEVARALLDQPGARSSNVLFAIVAAPTLVAWAVAFGALAHQYQRGTLAVLNVVLLAAGVSAMVAGLFFLLRARLANRVALRVLTVELGARAPSVPRGAEECRCCGAPLPVRGEVETLLVLCAYCDAENLLGIDLRGERAAAGAQAATLDRTLETRRRELSRYRLFALAAFALLPLSVWSIEKGFEPLTEKARALHGCRISQWSECVHAGALEEADEQHGKASVALAFYEKACNATKDLGCLEVARLLRGGRGDVPADPPRAYATFGSLCDERQRAEGCTTAGLMEWGGQGVGVDKKAAYAHFERGCSGGDGLGCFLQGAAAAAGDGAPKDEPLAVGLYRRACEKQTLDGCDFLADALEAGRGAPADPAQAKQLRERSCEAGSAYACSFVAEALVAGDADAQGRAVLLLRKGCNSAQQARACWLLGKLHRDGKLAETTYDTASKYLQMGCSLGVAASCGDFAAYSSEGAAFVKAACARGVAQACQGPK
jgi:hypothetical protein